MKELEDKRMKHLNQLNSDLLPITFIQIHIKNLINKLNK